MTPEERRAYAKGWREKNKEKLRAYFRQYYAKNRAKKIQAACQWKIDNPERAKEAHAKARKKHAASRLEYTRKSRAAGSNFDRKHYLKARYGLTIEQYKDMLEAQGGLCMICNRPETRKLRGKTDVSLAVDHCHSTGNIRGLLCGNCNKGIGLLGDNADGLAAALRYLTRDVA